LNASPILSVRAEAVREVTAAVQQGRCVAILAPEVTGSSTILQLAADELSEGRNPTHVVVHLNLPRGSRLPINDFFRSTLRHMVRRLKSAAPDMNVRQIVSELYGESGQSLLPESHSAALQFEEVLAVLVDEFLMPEGRRLVIAADHLGKVAPEHLREFGNIIHRLWEELDGHLVLVSAGSEALYSLCRRGSGDGHFSAFHIAHRVEVDLLTRRQTAEFVDIRIQQLGLAPAADQRAAMVETVLLLTGGHPYFIDRVLNEIAAVGVHLGLQLTPDDLAARICSDDDHLEAVTQRVLAGLPPRLRLLTLERLREVIAGPAPSYLDRDPAIEALRWMGFIRARDGEWAPRNWIYEHQAVRLLEEAERTGAAVVGEHTVITSLTSSGEEISGTQTLDAVDSPLFDNRYRIRRSISSGAFGSIFEATDTLLDATVALKRLHPHLSNERVEERFRREVLIARRLSHPNVIRVHDIGKADGALYYTMEYVNGGNLADRFAAVTGKARRMLLPHIVELCHGLDALHSAGIIHRDLKPENALLDAEGHIHLADFGISVALDMGRLTGAGAVGTPLYMSPEQTTGDEITPASDLYTVGVLLFELLAGHPPFQSEDIRTLMGMHVTQTPPDLRTVVTVEDELADLVRRCLAKLPEERPQTASEVALTLERVLARQAPLR